MAFETGHEKLGGRKKGALNKKTLIKADDLLLGLNVNPIQRLVEIAESELSSIEQQIRCWQEVAKYTYPKLKSQEIYIEQESCMPTRIEIVAYGEDKVDKAN